MKYNPENSVIGFFVLPVEYLIKKLPLPMKQGTFILIEVKSYKASLHSLLISTGTHLKSVRRYKFLILYTYHMDTLNIL